MTAAELERVARDQWPRLFAAARRHARTRADAEDAVQEALAIAFEVRERICSVAYIAVIAQHEASKLGRRFDGVRSLDQPLPGTNGLSGLDLLADHRQPDRDAMIDAMSRLRQAKPDHARALMARGLGWRYREICDAFEWTYTKVLRLEQPTPRRRPRSCPRRSLKA